MKLFKDDIAAVPTARQWLVVVVGLLVLVGAGLYRSYSFFYHHARFMAEQQLQSVAALKAQEIQQWLNDRLVFLSEPPGGVVAHNLMHILNDRDPQAAGRILQERFRHVHASNPEVTSVWLYDLDGRPVIGSHAIHNQLDDHHRAAGRKVLASRQAQLVDIHLSAASGGEAVIDILVPLMTESGDNAPIIGFARFQLDPSRFLFPTLKKWPLPSDTAESLLVRLEGKEALFLNPLRHTVAPPLTLRRSLDTPGLLSAQALSSAGAMVAGVDYRNEPVHGVVLKIAKTDWLLIAKMDTREVYRDARRNVLWVGAVAVVFLAVMLALGRIFVTMARARAREARYRMLAESGSDVVWLYDLATQRFTYVSPSVVQFSGYTVAEALKQSMADALTPESLHIVDMELPEWLMRFAKGEDTNRTRYYEATQRRKDGSVIDVEAVATLITDAQGRVTHIQGISRDVTARKRTEGELRKLFLAVEQSPVSTVITNLDAEIEYVNAAFVRSTGYSREEVFGKNPRILHSGKTPPATYTDMWDKLSHGHPWHGELRNRRKDGSEYLELASITPIVQPDGRVTHYLAVKEDITERRRMMEALAESENKFRTIYDSINDAIFVHDATSGRVLDVNASACQMYGYSREELLKLDVAAISSGEPHYTIESAQKKIREALSEGWSAFEWRARDSTGRQFWVAVNLKALDIGGGHRVLAVIRDIDSRKRSEEELRGALAEAKALNHKLEEAQNQLLQSEKMASIGQLAAGVAHELNNPIGFVSSNIGTLERYLEDIFAIAAAYEAAEKTLGDSLAAFETVHVIKREKDFDFLKTDIVQLMVESKDGLGRVAKIVRDLKDFSRAGEATFQWADLHQGLDSTLNIVWNELKYKCTVHKEYGELPQIWCVPSQLNQVFMNLLVNAAHAIPEKGDITLRTGHQGDEVFVAVSDTGTGIAPEHLHRVFEPFFTTKPVGKGTGLGLSLAYSIVKKHQGRFEVQSELGKGSTFTVWLPIEAKVVAETATSSDAAVPPGLTS